MPSKKNRIAIPDALAAKVQFLSDRTCCVCHTKGKPFQIHHIDGNKNNNTFRNLAVLCLDCHDQTQIRGGFSRKLDAEQVILYRDEWLIRLARGRITNSDEVMQEEPKDQAVEIEVATTLAEIYRERKEYTLLAMHYHRVGNKELRDKYIELSIQWGVDETGLISLRGLQNRLDLVPPEIIEKRIKQLEAKAAWQPLGRFYRELGDIPSAVLTICKGIIADIENENFFGAAFYLKEMFVEGDLEALFMNALEKAREQNNLWWQFRALQELEWTLN